MAYGFMFLYTFISLNLIINLPFSNAAPSTNPARRNRFLSRQGTQDPWDQSWLLRWAAVGDSYAAGIGAGGNIDKACSRYDLSYPYLIETDPDLSGPDDLEREFQFVACSGATSQEVIDKQISVLNDNQDVITVSAGGNDVGLTQVLGACVYQWAYNPGANAQGDCDTAMQNSLAKIQQQLSGNIGTLLEAAKKKLSPSGTIYVTAYARFFGESAQCDSVTWSSWSNQDREQIFLTLPNRQFMNRLVTRTNQAIKEAVDIAGPQVVYVDYDAEFEMMRGRFCEVGVTEPDANRENLFFYETGTVDSSPEEPGRKRDWEPGEGTFETTIQDILEQAKSEHPELELASDGSNGVINIALPPDDTTGSLTQLSALPPSATEYISINPNPTALAANLNTRGLSFVPDSWLRIFHPRPMAHQVIARLVLWHMAQRRAEILNLPAEEREGDELESTTCSIDPGQPDAPKCSQCEDGGGSISIGFCLGGAFDGRVCCYDDQPMNCAQTGCNGVDGKCQGQYQGCACTAPEAPPAPSPSPPPYCNGQKTDGWTCPGQCSGNIPCSDWCNDNCNYCFPVC